MGRVAVRRNIRIIKLPRKPTFAEGLEAEARRVVNSGERRQSGARSTIEMTLERQIALTLDQMQQLRRAHENVRRNLLRVETYIDTEIIQRTPRVPVYDDPRLPERDMLRARLFRIEQERRKLLVSENDQLRQFHDRVLELTRQRFVLRRTE